MRLTVVQALVGAALNVCAAAWQIGEVRPRFEEPKVWMSGVCNVTTDAIECWKPDGSPDQLDSEFAKAFFAGDPRRKLQIAFRRRTMLIITREILLPPGSVYPYLGVADSEGNFLDRVDTAVSGRTNQESVNVYWYYPSISASSADFDLRGWLDTGRAASVECKTGAIAFFPGFTLTVDSVEEIDEKRDQGRYTFPLRSGPEWRLDFSRHPVDVPGESTRVNVEIHDTHGHLVTSVDERGIPASAGPAQLPEELVFYDRASGNPSKFRMRVRPASVRELVITASPMHIHRFGQVRLSPKPSSKLPALWPAAAALAIGSAVPLLIGLTC